MADAREDIPLAERMQAFMRDPEGYETNRDLGLAMIDTSALVIPAEKHLLKALSFDREDAHRELLLDALAGVLRSKGDFDSAIAIYTQLFNREPESLSYLPQLGDALFMAGRIDEASNVYKVLLGLCHQRARQEAANRRGPVIQLIFAHRIICSRFGELAEKLDLYVKARILGLTPEVTAVLLTPQALIVNNCLLDYWKKVAGRYVTFISDESEIREFEETYVRDPIFVDNMAIPDGRVLNRPLAYIAIQRRWEDEGRSPLLQLSDAHRAEGRRTLARLGIPEDAWIVTLHIREAGYHMEGVPWDHNTLRNADIATCMPAIEEIIRRGGWVVRMGDASMAPLPAIEGLIDYALSEVRSDWMDLFCCSQCRFFLGSTSGPVSVAFAFGVPVVGINWFPVGFWWPYSTRDIFIHKLLRRRDDGGYLTVAESVKPPLPGTHPPDFYESRGIEVEDNTADDILGVVVEMLERGDGRLAYCAEDERLQARYMSMAEVGGVPLNARLGARFLDRHRFLIGEGAR